MNKKQFLFTVLFCLYLKFFYFNLANWAIGNFYNICDRAGVAISEFQAWGFAIITIVYYFFFILAIVGLFTYWFRHFRPWIYLAFGFLIRYTEGIFVFLSLLLKGETEFLNVFSRVENVAFLLSDLSVTFLASFLAYKYVRRMGYLDKSDKVDFTLWGVSKWLWCLIILAFNPILGFLAKYSVLSVYQSTAKDSWLASLMNIFNIEYKGGFSNVLMNPLMACMLFALSIYAFYVALKAVKDPESRYRKIKIAGILILLPVLIIIMQILVSRAITT